MAMRKARVKLGRVPKSVPTRRRQLVYVSWSLKEATDLFNFMNSIQFGRTVSDFEEDAYHDFKLVLKAAIDEAKAGR